MKTLIAEIYFSEAAAYRSTHCWFWRLKGGNSRIIAVGAEGFTTARSARRAFNNVLDKLTRVPCVVRTVIE